MWNVRQLTTILRRVRGHPVNLRMILPLGEH